MKLNEKIIRGLAEAQTDEEVLNKKYIEILERLIKKVNFGKLALIERFNKRGFRIKNTLPKGNPRPVSVHYPIRVLIQYTIHSIESGIPGFEMELQFGDEGDWTTYIDSKTNKNGFSEEEIIQKLKELKKVFEEVRNMDASIVDRLSK